MGPLFQFIGVLFEKSYQNNKKKRFIQIKFSEVKNNRLKEFL